jgi:hypothetical protein
MALGCLHLVQRHRRLRIAGLTLAGVIATPVDPELAIHALSRVFATRAEVADNHIFRDYSPITRVRLPIVGISGEPSSAEFPLNRDAVGAILVRLYVAAGTLDAAAAVAAELQDAPLVEAARTLIDIESRMGHLRRQQQIRGSGDRREV